MRAGLTQTGISHVSGLEISALLLRPYRKAPDEEAKVTASSSMEFHEVVEYEIEDEF